MKLQTTRIYSEIQGAKDKGYTTVSLQGSSRSSKTYNTVIWLVVYCVTHPHTRVSIVRATLPAIKGSVYVDFKEIMFKAGLWNDKAMNKSEMTYEFSNGSLIEFFSTDSEQKLRGRKRDILYVNEANELLFIEWQQLKMRTTTFSIVDYNPSFSDEHWLCNLNNEEKTYHFISTYKDNPFLEQNIIDEIESLRYKNKSLWQVYGLGLQAIVEGLIFTGWDEIEEIPDNVDRRWLGMDFGYSCFEGDTLVTCIDREKPIRDIQEGDLVLTRDGYRRVKRKFNNGMKNVVRKAISIGERTIVVSATVNHNFNVNGTWKKYGDLTKKDSLFVLSSSKVSNTDDTLTANTQTTTITSGKRMENISPSCCIMQYMRRGMARLKQGLLSIIRMETLSTMTSVTSLLLHPRSIFAFMHKKMNGGGKIGNRRRESSIPNKIGGREGKRQWKDLVCQYECADNAEESISLPMCINASAPSNAIIDGSTQLPRITLSSPASIAASSSKGTDIPSPRPVAQSAPISSCGITDIRILEEYKTEVYDLEIDGVHEYFANGILVHNCDPTAIVEVAIEGNDVYLDEVAYNTHMLTEDIIRELKSQRCRGMKVISESADPRMITEIHRAGVNIHPVTKYKGSINEGIAKMLEYRFHITRRSASVKKEFKNYTYSQDKEGKWLNEPIDAYNHAMDAIRYVFLEQVLGGEKKKINTARIKRLINR